MPKFVRILVSFLFLFLFVQNAYSQIVPYYSYSIKNTGIGILKMPCEIVLYKEKNQNSKIITDFNYNKLLEEPDFYEDNLKKYFFYFDKSTQNAFAIVNDEEGDGWYEIFYDLPSKKTAWIKTDSKNFYTWRDFFYKYGKKNGLYLFKDIKDLQKKLYAEDSENSQSVGKFETAKYVQLVMIKGNWMLVRIFENNKYPQIGWFCWRTQDGQMLLFPNIK